MARTRAETLDCLADEWGSLEKLLRTIDDASLELPTRCTGMSLRDVAAHAVITVSDIHAGRTGTRSSEEEAAECAGWTAAQLADELASSIPKSLHLLRSVPDEVWAGPSPLDGMTVAQAVEAGILEAVVHLDDLRHALGRPSERTAGLQLSLEHVADLLTARGVTPMTLAADGLPEITVAGGGKPVEGDAWDLLLATTGRLDPAKVNLDARANVFA